MHDACPPPVPSTSQALKRNAPCWYRATSTCTPLGAYQFVIAPGDPLLPLLPGGRFFIETGPSVVGGIRVGLGIDLEALVEELAVAREFEGAAVGLLEGDQLGVVLFLVADHHEVGDTWESRISTLRIFNRTKISHYFSVM